MVGDRPYERVLPAHFNGDGEFDDRFMNSMLTKWALERKTKEGAPSGQFYMNRAGVKSVAHEVLMNNLKMSREQADKHLESYFERSFLHYDVNRTDLVELGMMPMLMKFLSGQGYVNNLHAQVNPPKK